MISVSVLERQTVGVYDVVTLSGENGNDLLKWLNQNGFYTSTNALRVISSYAAQHWVFVAVTINRELPSSQRSQPHPLAFTFRSNRPVYPLRLTGIENEQCSIELYVFGPGRSEADGFKVEYCGTPSFPRFAAESDIATNRALFQPPTVGEFRIGSPEVRPSPCPHWLQRNSREH